VDPLHRAALDALHRFPRRPVDRPDLTPAAVGVVLVQPGPALLLTRRAST
jgi:hypothetical protein